MICVSNRDSPSSHWVVGYGASTRPPTQINEAMGVKFVTLAEKQVGNKDFELCETFLA